MLGAAGITIAHGAALDPDVAEPEIGKCKAFLPLRRHGTVLAGLGLRRRRLAERPVRPARGVDLEVDDGLDQNEALDFEGTAEQRPERELEHEARQLRHLGLRRAGRVCEGDVVRLEPDGRNERQPDVAADRELTAGRLADAALELRLHGLERNDRRDDDDGRHDHDEHGGHSDQGLFHGLLRLSCSDASSPGGAV